MRSPAARQRLPPVGALGHHEQCRGCRFGALGQQVGLDAAGDIGIERDPAFLVALADDPDPAPSDVHIGHRRPSTSAERSPDSSISPAIARSRQVRKLPSSAADSSRVNAAGQPPRLPQPQPRPVLRAAGHMRQQPAALARVTASRAARPRGTGLRARRVAHRPEREQRRDRRQPTVDRRRGVAAVAAVADRVHIPARTPRQYRRPAGGEKPQQHIDVHTGQLDSLPVEPTGKSHQIERVGPTSSRRVAPIRQVAEELVDQSEPGRSCAGQQPRLAVLHHPQPVIRHETQISQPDHPVSKTTM